MVLAIPHTWHSYISSFFALLCCCKNFSFSNFFFARNSWTLNSSTGVLPPRFTHWFSFVRTFSVSFKIPPLFLKRDTYADVTAHSYAFASTYACMMYGHGCWPLPITVYSWSTASLHLYNIVGSSFWICVLQASFKVKNGLKKTKDHPNLDFIGSYIHLKWW